MLCWPTDIPNIFDLAQCWRRSLKARAQIADYFRINSFGCGNPDVTSTIFPNISVRSVYCSAALPEACRLTCPLVLPWRDHRLLHADRQTDANNFSLQWRQHRDKITGTDSYVLMYMGLHSVKSGRMSVELEALQQCRSSCKASRRYALSTGKQLPTFRRTLLPTIRGLAD